jgi:2-polyprenyl-3-methyl-5-hydroxy-6-metoxy-1,4-benzoquinol methylase/uncharacterized Fe-S cluster-containing radical SAM superfamily protein
VHRVHTGNINPIIGKIFYYKPEIITNSYAVRSTLISMSPVEKMHDPSKSRHYNVSATPPFVLLEVTNVCNLRCRMCFIYGEGVTKKRSSGFMSEGVWRKAIEEIGSWDSPTTVDLHGAGEPLLHPQLFDIVSFSKSKKNISVGFLTNATLMDEVKARAVIETGVDWIGFSVDGSQKEVFEYYRKGAALREVEENIERLLRLRKKEKPSVYLNMVCHAEADPILFVDKWKGKVDTLLLSAKRYNDKEKNRAVSLQRPCPLLYEQLIMGWDGKTLLCCEDYYSDFITGSFPEKSIAEIWHGAPLTAARRLHERGAYGDIALCRHCDSVIFHEYAEEVVETEDGKTSVRRELSAIKPEYAASGTTCPLCGSGEAPFSLYRQDGLPVHECAVCGLKFTPLDTFRERYGDGNSLYSRGYFESNGAVGYSNYSAISVSNFLWQPAFIELIGEVNGKKVLDVGCATGILLGLLRERGAADLTGVEVSAYAAAEAAAKGFKVFNADILSLDEAEKYDIITAFDVMEHVPDLRAFLGKVRSLLRDDGIFVFLTPDAGSETALGERENWYGYRSSLEHIHYFSISSLSYIISETFHCGPILYQATAADGQGILGFIRKTPSETDRRVADLFGSNFSAELITKDNVVAVCTFLRRLGDARYEDYLKEHLPSPEDSADADGLSSLTDDAAVGDGARDAAPRGAATVIRRYRDGDEYGIVRLFREVFGREMSPEEWNWKYKGLENGEVRSVIIESISGDIVGHYGGITLRMIRNGREMAGVSIGDVMIHQKFRGFTRLKKLNAFFVDRLLDESFSFIYGFPTESTLMLPAVKLGMFERVEAVQEGVKDVVFSGGPVRYLYSLFPMDFDDKGVDELWAETGRRLKLSVIRDRAFFRWRYKSNRLFSYSLWGLRKRWSGRLLAVAAIKNEDAGRMIIMDALCVDGMLPVLLTKIENMAATAGVRRLTLWAPGQLRAPLKAKGYELIQTGTTLARINNPLIVSREDFLADFFYTAGDTDYL